MYIEQSQLIYFCFNFHGTEWIDVTCNHSVEVMNSDEYTFNPFSLACIEMMRDTEPKWCFSW